MTDVSQKRSGTSARSGLDASLFYNPTARGIAYQAALLIGVVLLFWWLQSNAAANMAAQGRATGFGFLFQTAGFNIGFSLLPFSRSSTYLDVYIVGILNTLLVAVIGIVLATILGFIIGIARLSSNFLIRKLATVYVEVMRNMPLLLQLFFWYFMALNALPAVRQSYELPLGAVLNQRGLYLPLLQSDSRFLLALGIFIVSIIAAVIWRARRIRKMEEKGDRLPVVLPMLGIVLVPTVIALLAAQVPIAFSYPELTGFNYTGGFVVPPELTALIMGLVIYTAAFIAEIVRAGIQAVNYGQVEAASALGLKEGDRLRLVVIPQAMRIIVPPLTSQYLNLTKNSSLGAAIAFPELVNVFMGTAINQSGRAVEIVALTMAVYLTFSLTTSLFMNWYNSRVALVER
ncbi:ABC transporter permease subunit [Pelagibacterium flavum]|uniref:ABC transporter permease subunit n=1 Tax=Pelagibacterium flavum TaxID=2984530 RepID=A0ABY6IN40_9HYPH|nr:ABC transporter permease subunit [Pelagibacterium sp. YIM 151497]UYQ70680.1 ABC transporter permease subunit [Pelagibacterium sp. YIM 151497]|tara:strand:+ start:3486 stop:4691 length:1206 start_codon:yes stop_codon:yes gene_type:complete